MPLKGSRILIVEDEYLIADDLAALLREAHAEVIGPVASLPMAMRLVADTEWIDAAVLDVNLRGVNVFPLADELKGRLVPIMFLTGYGANNIPAEYADVVRCEKPMGATHVVEELSALIPQGCATA
jgi:DNA-binding response OmpR family regulator